MSYFPTRILLATDGSSDAHLAGNAAADLAQRTGSELHLVHVWNPIAIVSDTYGLPPEVFTAYEDEASELLDTEVERLRGMGVAVAGRHLLSGQPATEIVQLGETLDVGLITMGSRGRGPIARLLLGSVSEGVVHGSTRPVLVLRGGTDAWPPQRIVVGDDLSPSAERAANIAASIAALYSAEMVLVTAYPALPAQREGTKVSGAAQNLVQSLEQDMESRAQQLAKTAGRMPEVRVADGDPADILLRAAEEAGPALIAVGSRRLGTLSRIRLGSVSTKVLRASHSPVLVYPQASERQAESSRVGEGATQP